MEADGHYFILSDDNEEEDDNIKMENSNLYVMEVLEAPLINSSHLNF